jgi:hypothetical protein
VCCRGEGEQDNFVLFLDADEIIDSDRMIPWLQSGVTAEYDVIELAAYEYGSHPAKQNLPWSHAGLLIRRDFIQRGFLLHGDDRYFYKDAVVFPNQLARVNLIAMSQADNEPMVHHYSFARATQANLKRKVLLSGHFDDGNSKHSHLGISGMFADSREDELLRSKSIEDIAADEKIALDRAPNRPWRVVSPFLLFDPTENPVPLR